LALALALALQTLALREEWLAVKVERLAFTGRVIGMGWQRANEISHFSKSEKF
jgi:hypothetical protein